MVESSPIRTALYGLLFVTLGSALVWLLLGRPSTGIDDADIFFVYARNMAAGHGWVYNVGGEAVEGFTSLLWAQVCSGVALLSPKLELPLFLINLLLGTVVVGVCLRRTGRPGLLLLLVATVPAWFAWCQVTLMETGLWCLWITLLGLAVAERRTVAVCLLLPLLVATRPESMLWGGWAVLLLVMRQPPAERLRSGVSAMLPFVATLAALVAYRLWYFGYPVPNTYYAKVSPDRLANIWNGSQYLLRYATGNAAVLLVLAAAIMVLIRRRRERPASFWLMLFLLPGLGIPVLVGGDHFGGYRFFQPLWPLLCLVAVNEWPKWASRFHPRVVQAALALLLVGGWLLFPFTSKLRQEFRIAREGRANGAALCEMFRDLDPLPTVAVITAGGNKLAYPGHVYDLMGLNSTEMGHAPGDGATYKNHTGFNRGVFYRWQPDILLCGDSPAFDALVLNGLHGEPRFMTLYSKCTLHRNGASLSAFYRNEFLGQLAGKE
jgi:arabinofuranosyltransferase